MFRWRPRVPAVSRVRVRAAPRPARINCPSRPRPSGAGRGVSRRRPWRPRCRCRHPALAVARGPGGALRVRVGVPGVPAGWRRSLPLPAVSASSGAAVAAAVTHGSFAGPAGRRQRAVSRIIHGVTFDKHAAPTTASCRSARNCQLSPPDAARSPGLLRPTIRLPTPRPLVQVQAGDSAEMVTATQSCQRRNLQLLGGRADLQIQVSFARGRGTRELLESSTSSSSRDEGRGRPSGPGPPVARHGSRSTTSRPSCARDPAHQPHAPMPGGINPATIVRNHVCHRCGRSTSAEIHLHRHPRVTMPFTAYAGPPGPRTTALWSLVVACRRRGKPQTTEGSEHSQASALPSSWRSQVDKEGADPQRLLAHSPITGSWPRSSGATPSSLELVRDQADRPGEPARGYRPTADAELDLRATPIRTPRAPSRVPWNKVRGPCHRALVQLAQLHSGDSNRPAVMLTARVRAIWTRTTDPSPRLCRPSGSRFSA